MPEAQPKGPYIFSFDVGGKNNDNQEETLKRLERQCAYKDLSTVIIVPSLDVTVDTSDPKNPKVKGAFHPKVVANWWGLMTPPNQQVYKLFAVGMEVGEAYSRCIENVLAHPQLNKCKYICTMETDNTPPADGLIKLLMEMEAHPEFACIGGLYFTKGDGGVAQIWGDPNSHPINFRPQKPVDGQLVECNGTGMGFNVWRMDMFKDERLRKPWFKTTASAAEGIFTQDLYFWMDAKKHGYRAAIDCSVKVGHVDLASGDCW